MSELERSALGDVFAALGIPMASTLGALARPLVEEHLARTSKTLVAAEALSGLQREQIAERVRQKPENLPLLVRVLQASGTSGNDRTLAMLGEALGRALREPLRRPREELLVVAIDGLTEEQLEVLAVCTTESATTSGVLDLVVERVAAELVPMALTLLHTRGLLLNPYSGFGGGEHWRLSELGIAVKDAASAAFPVRLEDDS